jgi:hypothetical protein
MSPLALYLPCFFDLSLSLVSLSSRGAPIQESQSARLNDSVYIPEEPPTHLSVKSGKRLSQYLEKVEALTGGAHTFGKNDGITVLTLTGLADEHQLISRHTIPIMVPA